jgi:hypothetical protein
LSTESVFQATDAKHAAVLGVGRLPNLIGHHVVLVDVKCVDTACRAFETFAVASASWKFIFARFLVISIRTLVTHCFSSLVG